MKNAYLDLARGLAALAVMAGHLRSFLFVDYAESPVRGILWQAFYLLTGFGHQMVMIFFVLSGFLITRQIYEATASGRWSAADYALKRASRLLIVLIPALFLIQHWLKVLIKRPERLILTGSGG